LLLLLGRWSSDKGEGKAGKRAHLESLKNAN